MINNSSTYLKKIYIRAKRRGMVELDLVLGFMADKYLATMAPRELKIFAELLDEDDELIYKWLVEPGLVPPKYAAIWANIKKYKSK